MLILKYVCEGLPLAILLGGSTALYVRSMLRNLGPLEGDILSAAAVKLPKVPSGDVTLRDDAQFQRQALKTKLDKVDDDERLNEAAFS
jgi:hypothetical protein